MDIVIAGATGLIGGALTASLEVDGHRVRRITRTPSRPGDIGWDPAAGALDLAALSGADIAVNFAGHPIGRPHWTASHRRKVLDSRVQATGLLARSIAALRPVPKVLISASAVGFYGDRGDEVLTEASSKGSGFLSDVCEAWEHATEPASDAGIPVSRVRTGIVVSANGGALGPMLPIFKLGLGGRLGSGKQFWPWISLTDHVRAVRFLMARALEGTASALDGPVNLSGPEPQRVREITAAIGRVLHRPAGLPVPSFAIKMGTGSQMAREMILVSQRVMPQRLLDGGFEFAHHTFEEALTVERAALAGM